LGLRNVFRERDHLGFDLRRRIEAVSGAGCLTSSPSSFPSSSSRQSRSCRVVSSIAGIAAIPDCLRQAAGTLLQQALIRGEVERGEAGSFPACRCARRVES